MIGGRHTLHIDPGAVDTGVVICLVTDRPDHLGHPILEPVDGLTVARRPSEDPLKRFTGQPAYAARAVLAVLDLLDRHGIADDQLDQVFIEAAVYPQPRPGDTTVEGRIWVAYADLCLVLGHLTATWPEHWLVPPRGRWPRGTYGWDADPEPVPAELTGRRPKHWSPSEANVRSHEKSAYCMGRAGWRKWRSESATRGLIEVAAAPEGALVAAVVAAVRDGASLTAAVRAASPSRMVPADLVDLAVAAADVLQPGAGTKVRPQIETAFALSPAQGP